MGQVGKLLAKAAAVIAAAFALWLGFGAEGFRSGLRAAFPASPALSGETVEQPAVVESPKALAPAGDACEVVRIIDGDTARVRCGNGPEEPVRFVGVDSPEVARQGKPAECGASAATDALSAAIGAVPVYLYPDPEQADRDRYGRLLRFVATTSLVAEDEPWQGSVNLSLVRAGASAAYRDLRYGGKEEFLAAEDSARLSSLGLWGKCQNP